MPATSSSLCVKLASAPSLPEKVATCLSHLATVAYYRGQLSQAQQLAKTAAAVQQGVPLVQAFEKTGSSRRKAAHQALSLTKVLGHLLKQAANPSMIRSQPQAAAPRAGGMSAPFIVPARAGITTASAGRGLGNAMSAAGNVAAKAVGSGAAAAGRAMAAPAQSMIRSQPTKMGSRKQAAAPAAAAPTPDLAAVLTSTINNEVARHGNIQKHMQSLAQQTGQAGGRAGGGAVGGLGGAALGAAGLPALAALLLRKVPAGGALSKLLSQYLKPRSMGPLRTAIGHKLPWQANLGLGAAGAVGGGALGSSIGGSVGDSVGSSVGIAKGRSAKLPDDAISPLVKMLQGKGATPAAPVAAATAVPKPKVPSVPPVKKAAVPPPAAPPAAAAAPMTGAPPGVNPTTLAALAAILGVGGVAGSGAMSGATVGAPLGAAMGLGRGNMAEGLGRGLLRGGATGAGASLGALAGGMLGGVTQDPALATMGTGLGALAGGAAGYIGGGKVLGPPAGAAEEEQSQY